MSCTELSQVISCTGGPMTTPNFTREGSDTPMSSSRRRKRSNSGSAGSGGGLVTLNVYATKVCLRFPSSPSPPASLFYTTSTSPSPEQPNNIPREKSNNVSEGVEESCTELIDVSDYKCECDDRVDLDSESETVSCQDFTWYVKHSRVRILKRVITGCPNKFWIGISQKKLSFYKRRKIRKSLFII